jgi:hypothetical protein
MSKKFPFPKEPFKVGFEFETRNTIKTDRKTKDKIVEKMAEKIKGSDKVTRSFEFIEPYKYIDFSEKLEEDAILYNVEYQFGVFDNDTSNFEKEFKILKTQIKSIVDTENINVNGKDYKVSFIDIDDKRFTKPDDTGVIQMTTTFQLRFLPNLFRLMSTFISLSPVDFFNGFIYTTSYNETLYLLNSSKVEKDETLFGFMLYIVYYWKITFETKFDRGTYFKAYFPIKPRTNFSTLYENMSPSIKLNIFKIFEHLLARQSEMIQKVNKNIYLFFVYKTLDSLINPKPLMRTHYYIKNLPDISDGFYYLEGCTKEMIEAVPGVVIEQKSFYTCDLDYTLDVDTCDLYELQCKDHDNKLFFDGTKYLGIPVEVCEWPAVGDNISMEFRIWSEIVRVTERIAKEEKDMENYEKLSDILYKKRLTINDFEVCIRLLFIYFIPRIFKKEPKPFVELSFLTKSKLKIQIDGVKYKKDIYNEHLIDRYKNFRNISGEPTGILSIDDFIKKLNEGSVSIKKILETPPRLPLLQSSPPRSPLLPYILSSPPRSPLLPYRLSSPPNSPLLPYRLSSPPRSPLLPYRLSSSPLMFSNTKISKKSLKKKSLKKKSLKKKSLKKKSLKKKSFKKSFKKSLKKC